MIHFNYGIYNTGVSPKKEPKTILEQIEPTCIHHSDVGQRVCPDNLAPSLVDCLDSEHVICSPCRQAGRQTEKAVGQASGREGDTMSMCEELHVKNGKGKGRCTDEQTQPETK